MRALFIITLGAFLAAPARAADKPEEKSVQPVAVVTLDRKAPVLYDKDVEPILVHRCLVCHSGAKKKARLDMTTYQGLMKGGKSGPPIVAGKSGESLLVKLAGRAEEEFMPPEKEAPLKPEELALIKLWIDQGAKAPTGARVRPKAVLGALPSSLQPVRALAVSPDKSMVAAGRANQVHVYHAGTGAYIRTLLDPDLKAPDGKPAAHLSIVEALAFSPDGKTIASGSYQEVVLWDAQSGAVARRLAGFADRVVALAFAPDGKLLAAGGGAPSEDGELKVCEVSSGAIVLDVKNGHSDTVYGVCFSPDGGKLASCGADKFVKVFEVPGGKLLKSFEGHTHHVLDVGWKGDGKLLASAGADNVIKVWDYEKGEPVRAIAGHGKQITRLLFVGKTSQILTCSGDLTVSLWNVDNGGRLRTFGGAADYLYAAGVSPDGAVVAAGGEEGVVRLYNGGNGQLVKTLLPPGVETPAPKK